LEFVNKDIIKIVKVHVKLFLNNVFLLLIGIKIDVKQVQETVQQILIIVKIHVKVQFLVKMVMYGIQFI
jgi:hypothetical protein